MAAPGIPSNFNLQTANAQNYISWAITAGALSYDVQRSLDGIDFISIANPTATDYLDTAVTIGTQYWYRAAAFNGTFATLTAENIDFTAISPGTDGNNITIEFAAGGTAGSEVVTVVGQAISVQIQDSVSTRAQVVTAIQNSAAASSLISAVAHLSGSVVGTFPPTNLAGATNTGAESAFTVAQSCVPTPVGEMSLGQLRLSSQQRADRVNSNFVTLTEWNSYINQSLFELYDLLVTAYGEEYFAAPAAQFVTTGATQFYPLPDGVLTFTSLTGSTFVAPPFYKLLGVDLGLNASSSSNGWCTLRKFNFADRNKYFYPNSSSTIYGVYNAAYRILGNQMEFIPNPSANQPIRLWYIPKMTMLLKDIDITTSSISGWIEYVIVDAAIKALQKEESDISALMVQKQALMKRIEGASMNRDAGMPDRVVDVRGVNGWGGGQDGGPGGYGAVW